MSAPADRACDGATALGAAYAGFTPSAAAAAATADDAGSRRAAWVEPALPAVGIGSFLPAVAQGNAD
jgi:hypothetical protein